jgi:DNA-directed RNA polymerase subunit RPC12/RpoP
MFRCLECGKAFERTREIEEAHGEKWYVCPHCGEHHYKPFIENRMDRREVIERAVDVMRNLNTFRSLIEKAFNSCCFDGSDIDFAMGDLHDLIVYAAGDSEFDLPDNISDKIFDVKTEAQASKLFDELTYNIEE